jgi:tetratricopeptide (TPR) repeat protein
MIWSSSALILLALFLSLNCNLLLQKNLYEGLLTRSSEKPTSEGRSLLADYFLRKAVDYYHSGALPSIFAMGQADSDHEFEEEHELHGLAEFLSHFYPTAHTHLESGGATGQRVNYVAEILPWVWTATKLDPHRDYPYVEAAYWLRRSLGLRREGEGFLREGLRNNPDSVEIQYELGRIAYLDYDNFHKGRYFLTRAFQRLHDHSELRNEHLSTYSKVLGLLAQLEEDDKEYLAAVKYLEILRRYSPNPEAIRRWSIDMQLKISH